MSASVGTFTGMGFRYRRSLRIMPGVHLNLTKRGVGLTLGGHGVHYSVHSSGRQTTSVHLGPGLTWMQTSNLRSSPKTSASRTSTPISPHRAPLLPSRPHFWEHGDRALYDLVVGELRATGKLTGADKFDAIAAEHPEVALPARLLAGFAGEPGDGAIADLTRVFADPTDVAAHPFTTRYLVPLGLRLRVNLALGVTAELPPARDTATLALAELYQRAGWLPDAIACVERVTPTTIAAVSLAELYTVAGRWDDVVDTTNGVTNVDDPSALLLVYRASALRHLGHPEAALDALREVVRFRSRAPEIRHQALAERAETYASLGQRAKAREDLERILAEDAEFPGVQDRLAALSG